jgi:hypothetical protein
MGTDNIRALGECEITYNSVDLGLSKGGCEVQITDAIHKTVIDKYGTSPVKAFEVGVEVMATVNLVEHDWNIFEQIYRATGTLGAAPDRITFGSQVGEEVVGKELRLHPRNETGGDYDIIIYLAVPDLDQVVSFTIEGERIYTVPFFGVIDTSRTEGDLLFRIGNDS